MLANARRGVVRVHGADVHFAEMGAGEPLVLLHGLNDSHRTWSRVAPALARRFRVVMPDLPGHGLSSRPDTSYSLDYYADVVSSFLREIGVERADVVGHSFGGGVGQLLLVEHRPRVRRLALVASGGLGRDVTWALRLAASPWVERFGQPFFPIATRIGMRALGTFDDEDVEMLAWMNAMPGTARAFARTVRDVIDLRGQRRHFLDRAHEVAELPPVAVFWGDSDPILPVAHGVGILDHVDGLTLARFRRCGHFPHREHPEAFVDALTSFLERGDLAPARVRAVPIRRRPTSAFRRAIQALGAAARRLFAPAPSAVG